ncbi:MAG: hypothetical protein ABI906_04780 [Pseudomonadota bacterium]
MLRKITRQSEGLDLQECREVIEPVFARFRDSGVQTLIWSCEGMQSRAWDWDAEYLERLLEGLDARIVFFVRYLDDWVESLVKERIGGRSGWSAERLSEQPLRPLGPHSGAEDAGPSGRRGSILEKGARLNETLLMMRAKLPGAEVVVQSFDSNRAEGRVVSGTLEAMGIPAGEAFPDADEEAEVLKPSKSDLFSMLLYHLMVARAGVDILRPVWREAGKRVRQGKVFEPLAGRRFRFLSGEDVALARTYYEDLRQHWPDLPAQPAYVSRPAERHLPREEAIAVLNWLRPDISDEIFERAVAAYPTEPPGRP